MSSPSVDFVSDLPMEVSLLIFEYLGIKSLTRCSKVSRKWKAIADDDHLWRRLCSRVWRKKQIHPFPFTGNHVELSIRGNYANSIASFTTKEMKSLLERRGVNTQGVYEKDEFKALVVSTTPQMLPAKPAIGTKWKSAYAAEALDGRRNAITWEEITRHKWMVYFSYNAGLGEHPPQHFEGLFGKDFIWHSQMGSHPWRFYGDNAVQVGQFPPLYAKRNQQTWEWLLTNDNVVLKPHYG